MGARVGSGFEARSTRVGRVVRPVAAFPAGFRFDPFRVLTRARMARRCFGMNLLGGGSA
jgi:hypothetical protein